MFPVSAPRDGRPDHRGLAVLEQQYPGDGLARTLGETDGDPRAEFVRERGEEPLGKLRTAEPAHRGEIQRVELLDRAVPHGDAVVAGGAHTAADVPVERRFAEAVEGAVECQSDGRPGRNAAVAGRAVAAHAAPAGVLDDSRPSVVERRQHRRVGNVLVDEREAVLTERVEHTGAESLADGEAGYHRANRPRAVGEPPMGGVVAEGRLDGTRPPGGMKHRRGRVVGDEGTPLGVAGRRHRPHRQRVALGHGSALGALAWDGSSASSVASRRSTRSSSART